MSRALLYSLLIFSITQISVWFQANGQFIWTWFKENPLILSLVNNPHRGGVITKGNPHRPGDIADWRFPLYKALTAKKIGNKYTLRISQKGIFYKKVEPPPKKQVEQ